MRDPSMRNLETDRERQAFMDFEHQIRAPLRHLAWRLPRVLQLAKALDHTGESRLVKEIQYLQGIQRKAQRAAGNIRLFTSLASGEPVQAHIARCHLSAVRGILIAAAMDHQLYAEYSNEPRRFEVNVDESASEYVYLDDRLLEQALDDLLDNANKYSFARESICIDVSSTKANFIISVRNRGLSITRDEVATIVERGHRGALASHVVGEGSGVGLWIVNEIMKAHNGSLEIQPTNSERYNFIRMKFRLK